MSTDVYYKKTLVFKSGRQQLELKVSQDLFSSYEVDKGTKLLLRSVVSAGYPEFRRILDMGCGYGPLGIMLKKLCPGAQVEMVDRDALAVEFARRNAADNGLDDVTLYPSLGFDDVLRDDYDLIVSNIPGKAGEPVIALLLTEAAARLSPGGIAAVVVVNPIAELAARTVASLPGVSLVFHREHAEHQVFHYRFEGDAPAMPSGTSLERGVYNRDRVDMQYGGLDYAMQTVYGLPEFDSLHHASRLLLDALLNVRDTGNGLVVFNPGQGHAAVFGWKLLRPERCVLFGRDILALRTSAANLEINGCPKENISLLHGIDISSAGRAGIVAGVIDEDEGRAPSFYLLDRAASILVPGGLFVAAGSSTAVTRLADHASAGKLGSVVSRRKSHGYASLVLKISPND